MRLPLLASSAGLSLALVLGLGSSALAQVETPAAPADSPLVIAPQTPDELLNAAVLMVNLGRIELANDYLRQLLALNPDRDTLMRLRTTHGSAKILELTRVEGLTDTAQELSNRLNAAVGEQSGDPVFINSLIADLEGSPRQRTAALLELRHLGAQAIPHLIAALRDKPDLLVNTVVQLRGDAAGPMIGALQAENPRTQALAAEVLGAIGGPREAAFLLAPAHSPDRSPAVQLAAREALARIAARNETLPRRINPTQSTRLLLLHAKEHLDGTFQWPREPGEVQPISLWNWQGTNLIESRLPERLASLAVAERLSRDAAQLSPDNQEALVLVLASRLEQDAVRAGYAALPQGPGTALDLAIRSGPEINVAVLDYALNARVFGAAIGALQALSRNGSMSLVSGRVQNQPVLAALDAPSARVQFAAAVTILNWEPAVPFNRSQRVVEILARALNADSATAGVVMDPNIPRGSDTAAMFGMLGFRSSVVGTGREGFLEAAGRGDVELAIVHPNVIRWDLSQTLANLRADARTARMPIVIYGPPEIHEKYNNISERYDYVAYVDETTSPEYLSFQLQPVLQQLQLPPLSQEQRGRQAALAAYWLHRIAIRNVGNVFDLGPAEEALTSAASNPNTAADAIIALGAIGRASVQATLAQLAITPGANLQTRALAAAELALHIERNNSLLSGMDVASLQDAYGRAGDPGLRSALGGVLGALHPSADVIRREILAVPATLPQPVVEEPPPAPEANPFQQVQ